LRSYRDKIKDPLIGAAEISPIEYKRNRGSQLPYNHDEADGIIIKLAGDACKNHPAKLRVFWLIYSCQAYSKIQKELAKSDKEGNPSELSLETVKKYARNVKKAVRDIISENSEERDRILEAIRNEFSSTKL
jgi:hypothetical protein